MKYMLILMVILLSSLQAQTKITNEEYVQTYANIAVQKMVEYQIPASITLAQGILESGSGNSKLAQNANNHFGIKCHTGWEGEGYYMDDDTENECFRVYKTPEESYVDHSKFLTERARYKFLFTDIKVDDYKAWAQGLKDAGYATNPNYPQLLISLIDRYALYQYDKIGLEQMYQLEDEKPIAEKPVTNSEDQLPKNAYYIDDEKDVFIYNRAKTLISKGRSLQEIASEYGIDETVLMKYNDFYEGYTLSENQFVYLQAKRKKGTEEYHIVQPGETMWEISQIYAIRLDKLYQKNNIAFDKQLKPGEKVYLKSKRSDQPAPYTYKEVLQEKNKIIEAEEAKKQAIIDAENKAKEEAAKKKLEAELAAQKLAAEKKAKEDLEKREQNALKDLEDLNQNKQAFDAEQHPPIQLDPSTELEKAPSEEVIIEKPYQEVNVKTYTVKAGDTLYSLSNKFYITVEKLKEMNNMKDNNLRVGQVLVVSP
jgi:LysM repeat protein